MGEFDSGDHYIYFCGKESLRRSGVAIIVNKNPECSTWMQSQKWQNDLCLFLSKPFNITVIQPFVANSNTEDAEVGTVLWLPTRSSRILIKDVLFIIKEYNAN